MPVLALLLVGLPCTAATLVVHGDRPTPSLVKPLRHLWDKLRRCSHTNNPVGYPGKEADLTKKEVRMSHDWGGACMVIGAVHTWAAVAGLSLASPSERQWARMSSAILATWAAGVLTSGMYLAKACGASIQRSLHSSESTSSASTCVRAEEEEPNAPTTEQRSEGEPEGQAAEQGARSKECAAEVVLKEVPIYSFIVAWFTGATRLVVPTRTNLRVQ
eukprot:5048985-Pyramimonas_sp.AAC.1